MRKKQVTTREIARQLGVSHITVCRALSQDPQVSARVAEKTRERIKRLATELGYIPRLVGTRSGVRVSKGDEAGAHGAPRVDRRIRRGRQTCNQNRRATSCRRPRCSTGNGA